MLKELESELYTFFKPKNLAHILGFEKTANEYCASLILKYFHKKIDLEIGQKISLKVLFSELGILPEFWRMYGCLLSILENEKLVSLCEEMITFHDKCASILDPAKYLDKIRIIYPKFYLFFSFLEKCVEAYPEILCGKKAVSQLLFPANDPFLLQNIYENTPKLGHEELYLHFAKEYLRNRLKNDSSLIEIGGGQGILTQVVLPEIHEHIGSYLFTDIGQSFLKDASNKWFEYYKFSTSLFDISKNPNEQGIICNSFDVLIGFNVIHATANIYTAIDHCLNVVNEGGFLCIVETVKQQFWIDMIYGLTSGWWLFQDFRSNSPLLSINQWEQVLSNRDIKFEIFPRSEKLKDETDTACIVIEKKGQS